MAVDKNGTLGFDMRFSNGSPSGADMFASAMRRFESEGVKVNSVRAAWVGGTDSVNTAEYVANLKKGMSSTEAAANTWTGRIAAKYGFTVVNTPKKEIFNDTVTVIFERP